MEKKQLSIKPLSYRGGPKSGLTFRYLLALDKDNRRLVTVHTPWNNYRQDPSRPSNLTRILQVIMDRSGIPEQMTEPEFMNLEWKQFKNVRISDKIL